MIIAMMMKYAILLAMGFSVVFFVRDPSWATAFAMIGWLGAAYLDYCGRILVNLLLQTGEYKRDTDKD